MSTGSALLDPQPVSTAGPCPAAGRDSCPSGSRGTAGAVPGGPSPSPCPLSLSLSLSPGRAGRRSRSRGQEAAPQRSESGRRDWPRARRGAVWESSQSTSSSSLPLLAAIPPAGSRHRLKDVGGREGSPRCATRPRLHTDIAWAARWDWGRERAGAPLRAGAEQSGWGAA